MGWGSCGTDGKGRKIGYAHSGRCDHPGCKVKIDRGLGYACGDMHGEDGFSCEGYFCSDHLTHEYDPDDGRGKQFCFECAQKLEAQRAEEFLEVLTDFIKGPQPVRYRLDVFRPGGDYEVIEIGTGKKEGHVLLVRDDGGDLVWVFREQVDFLDTTRNAGDITLGRDWAAAKTRFDSLFQPSQPPTPEQHRKAIYDLLLRWDETEDIEINPTYMGEADVKKLTEHRATWASFKKFLAETPIEEDVEA
jgi:hypothetical protein